MLLGLFLIIIATAVLVCLLINFEEMFPISFIFAIFMLIAIIIGFGVFASDYFERGYKQGQIDYINGEVKYEKDSVIQYKHI